MQSSIRFLLQKRQGSIARRLKLLIQRQGLVARRLKLLTEAGVL